MKTQVKKIGDTIVISMDGRLDFETSVPLREDLNKVIRQARTDSVAQIVFNLEKLEFVGSSGISSFVQTLKDFNATVETRPRYLNVRSEFKRIIKAFDEQDLFDFDDADDRGRQQIDQ